MSFLFFFICLPENCFRHSSDVCLGTSARWCLTLIFYVVRTSQRYLHDQVLSCCLQHHHQNTSINELQELQPGTACFQNIGKHAVPQTCRSKIFQSDSRRTDTARRIADNGMVWVSVCWTLLWNWSPYDGYVKISARCALSLRIFFIVRPVFSGRLVVNMVFSVFYMWFLFHFHVYHVFYWHNICMRITSALPNGVGRERACIVYFSQSKVIMS